MAAVPLVRPLTLRTLAGEAAPRRVTWLELFFDLVFVATVSQVAAPLSEGFSAAGLLRFGVLFVLVWWAWLGHTLFATRFDTDDLFQRGLTLLQMFIVAVMGINAGEALHSRESAGFAAAYAVLRLVLAAQYVRARRLSHTRPLSTCYLAGCSCAALLWLLSAFVSPPARFVLWAAAFLADVATPLVAERHSPRIPPDASHLPERFGLFTIILLGESVLAVMQGMRSQDTWSLGAAGSALASLALLFLLWWWYFDHAGAAEERHVRSEADAVRLRVWTYAHLPLYLGVALTGVGLEHVIRLAADGSHLHAGDAIILSGAVALLMAALVVIEAAGRDALRPTRTRFIGGLAVAGLTALVGVAGAFVPPVALVLALLALVLARVSPARHGPSGDSAASELSPRLT